VTVFRRSLASTILVLTVGSLGPACGLVTNDPSDDAAGGSAGSGAAGSGAAGTGAGSSGGGDIDDGQLPGGGSGGIQGTGGTCEFQTGESLRCPGYCTALLQAKCEEESPYALSSVQTCGSPVDVRVSWSDDTGGLSCDYQDGDLVGVHQYSHTTAFCGGTSTDKFYGTELTDCPAPDLQPCAGESAGSGGDTGEGGAPPDVPPADCYSNFSGTCGPCCPNPTPDCSDKPNGYPGYSCFSGFCSCSCSDGEWSCAC